MGNSTPFLSHGSKNLIDYSDRVCTGLFDRASDPHIRGVAETPKAIQSAAAD
jgi:hypothetical protein